MIKITAKEFAQVVEGTLHNIAEDMIIDHLPVINSKLSTKGTFFIAFNGNNFDGHNFVSEALSYGAAFALVSKEVDAPSIVVKDTGQALLKLATHVRKNITGLKVVGITGSQGKTTTKELLSSILSLSGSTISSSGNLNTDIGVPLTILRCTKDTEYCILEMGARHQGDILKLTKASIPDVGVVLVVGTAHLGEFGSVENIAKTKQELILGLNNDATAVLGSYDSWTANMAYGLPIRKILFGENQEIRAADIEMHGGFAHFDLVTPAGRNPVSLQVMGEQQIPNALAAASAAFALGISNEEIATGLTIAKLESKWRMQLVGLKGVQIIQDFYNANPESMKAAIKSLVLLSQESGGSSWAILGKMHELGEIEAISHANITRFCVDLGVDHLVSVATDLYMVEDNQTKGMHLQLHHCSNFDDVLQLVENFTAGDVLLLKASRSEKFEDLAEDIKDKWNGVQS
jgi:UDP-N-acetylmuramoyl-tripeptide--D-alanyl-D-alanine ligase